MVKNPGSQKGSPVVAEGAGEATEGGEWREIENFIMTTTNRGKR